MPTHTSAADIDNPNNSASPPAPEALDVYTPAPGQDHLYQEDYFKNRLSNDPKRLAQFLSDGAFIRKFIQKGRVLDVGCSTGEFLTAIGWEGEKYGMEISPFARDLAEKNGFRFDRDIFSERDFYDLIVFRGTIQHIDEPFRFMKFAHTALKRSGYIVFLATPNINSPYYWVKKTLPFLDPPRNFYLPDDINLSRALENFGFEVKLVQFPYLNTPYAQPLKDHFLFLKNILFKKEYRHAFWRSSMELIAQKR